MAPAALRALWGACMAAVKEMEKGHGGALTAEVRGEGDHWPVWSC